MLHHLVLSGTELSEESQKDIQDVLNGNMTSHEALVRVCQREGVGIDNTL